MLKRDPQPILVERVRRSARAARRWNATADLPDPLNYDDFSAHPAAATCEIEQRRKSGNLISSGSSFPYPKPSGGLRQLADLDAYASIDFRLRSGPVVAALAVGSDSGELGYIVYGHFEEYGETWRASEHKSRHRLLRDRSQQMADDPGLHGRLKLDVADYYPTIDPELIGFHLATAGLADAAAQSIEEFLSAFHLFPETPKGLPIGPEASLAIGTAFLLPVDRAIRRCPEVRLVRWMDDYIVGCVARDAGYEVAQRFAYQLSLQRQRPNVDKSQYAAQGEPFADAISLAEKPREIMGDASELLAAELALERYEQVPFLLGAVRSNGDEEIVDVVEKHPELLRRFPRRTAESLGAMAKGSSDVYELLTELALAPDLSDPARLHVVRTLRRPGLRKPGATTGKALFDQGCLHLERRASHPVAAECFAAANRSEGKPRETRDRSITVAREQAPSVNARRSLIGTLSPGRFNATQESAVREIGHKWPSTAAAAAMATQYQ